MTEELSKLFSEIEQKFIKGKLDKNVSIYFTLGDKEDEKWTVFVGPDKCEAKKGKATDSADCVVKTKPDFLMKIIREGYEPQITDFMWGKIKTNNPNVLEKFKMALKI